jgi:mannosyltransferase OCH1-like enzyme
MLLINKKNQHNKPYTYFKQNYNSVIPLDIYQTWHTKDLPPKMKERVELLKAQNPRFNHHLFDDNDCREFIKTHFKPDVLDAYDRLIPGAYKADLWRYCILYKEGGIYLDIKYSPYNEFKFINLTENEGFVLDLPSGGGIYNALMVCLPGNEILLKAINQIVENVEKKYYGISCLEPTGPMLLEKYFSSTYKNSLKLKHKAIDYIDNKIIKYDNYIILKGYHGYCNEREKYSKIRHYGELWHKKKIYI